MSRVVRVTFWFAIVSACAILVALAIWREVHLMGPRGEMLSLRIPDKEPQLRYAAYLTWRNYTGIEPINAGLVVSPGGGEVLEEAKAKPICEQAIYVWNGRDVGEGDKGFDAVLDLMGKLPKGSAIRLFPNYAALPEEKIERVGVVSRRIFPFNYSYPKLRDTVFDRGLKVVASVRDEQGRYCPEVLEVCKKEHITLPGAREAYKNTPATTE